MRHTSLIDVSYRSESPEAAKAIVRTVVDAFMDFVEEHHENVSVEIVSLLDEERRKIEEQLLHEQSELLVVKHRVRDLGLREGSTVTHPAVQRVVRLNESLVDVQNTRLELKATLAALQAAVKRGEDLRHHLVAVEPTVGRELMMGTLGLNPQLIEAVGNTERKLTEDKAKLQTWLEQLGPQHPEVIRLTRTVENEEDFLANYHRSIRHRLADAQNTELGPMLLSIVGRKLLEAEAHEGELLQEYAVAEQEAVSQNDRMAELQVAEHDVTRLQRLHDTLLNRITNVDINQNRSDVRVAIVSGAFAANRPVAPRLKFVVLFCLLAGVGGGIAFVYVLDVMDDRFRSPEEIKEQLGTSVLGIVRELKVSDAKGADAISVHVEPSAVECEAFRTLRTALAFAGQDMERIAVTSSEPGDGKTTVLANLATAYAQAGKKTLVIDADLRKPGLTKLFDLRGKRGLSEVLRLDGDIRNACVESIRNTGIPKLDILPCGPRPSDPAELLSRRRIADVIAWAEGVYDQVLVDCPPMQAASDAALVGREVDGVLLVVQPSENHRRAVIRSVESLRSMKINLVGVVTNRVAVRKGSYYEEGYGYGLGYGCGPGYGAEEGDDEDAVEMSIPVPVRRTIIPVRRRAA